MSQAAPVAADSVARVGARSPALQQWFWASPSRPKRRKRATASRDPGKRSGWPGCSHVEGSTGGILPDLGIYRKLWKTKCWRDMDMSHHLSNNMEISWRKGWQTLRFISWNTSRMQQENPATSSNSANSAVWCIINIISIHDPKSFGTLINVAGNFTRYQEFGNSEVLGIYTNQWEFQDPKMEVRSYHIRPYFGGKSTYIALT